MRVDPFDVSGTSLDRFPTPPAGKKLFSQILVILDMALHYSQYKIVSRQQSINCCALDTWS